MSEDQWDNGSCTRSLEPWLTHISPSATSCHLPTSKSLLAGALGQGQGWVRVVFGVSRQGMVVAVPTLGSSSNQILSGSWSRGCQSHPCVPPIHLEWRQQARGKGDACLHFPASGQDTDVWLLDGVCVGGGLGTWWTEHVVGHGGGRECLGGSTLAPYNLK